MRAKSMKIKRRNFEGVDKYWGNGRPKSSDSGIEVRTFWTEKSNLLIPFIVHFYCFVLAKTCVKLKGLIYNWYERLFLGVLIYYISLNYLLSSKSSPWGTNLGDVLSMCNIFLFYSLYLFSKIIYAITCSNHVSRLLVKHQPLSESWGNCLHSIWIQNFSYFFLDQVPSLYGWENLCL